MKKVYIISFIIIIIICIFMTNYVRSSTNKVTMEETIKLMKDMPATDYERDLEKTRKLLNMYNLGNGEEKSSFATIQNASKNISSYCLADNNNDEDIKIKLSSCYRAYKKGTLTFDILSSSIKSDISALNIELDGAKIYDGDNKNLISKIEEEINICEKYLEDIKVQKVNNTKSVYQLYEEYDYIYNNFMDEIHNLH